MDEDKEVTEQFDAWVESLSEDWWDSQGDVNGILDFMKAAWIASRAACQS